MLAHALGVDFEIAEAINVYDQLWLAREAAGEQRAADRGLLLLLLLLLLQLRGAQRRLRRW